MIPIILIQFAIFILYIIVEIINFINFRNIIKYNGIDLLKKELQYSALTIFGNLFLKEQTELKLHYIGKPFISFIFSYILEDVNSLKYGVLRYSKAHFLIKAKIRNLKNIERSITPKHIKFK